MVLGYYAEEKESVQEDETMDETYNGNGNGNVYADRPYGLLGQ